MTNTAQTMKRLVLPLVPMPASRARCRCLPGYPGGRPYTHPKYRKWLDATAADIRNRPLGEPLIGPVAIWVRFALPRPKTTILDFPNPDVDNYLKALMDAVTQAGNVWLDDKQVVLIEHASKVWTKVGTGGIVLVARQLPEDFQTVKYPWVTGEFDD